ncbi:NRDE-2, necessary for RNA interference-domain-containing protein [Gigaspora rosea]|uniref:NRDE-2, necessary for RNA interference-domain-containing protein n=1 Tax=Gigaspora rosea TaxID=44941 RepID=A0A397W2I7_9GLOM|nr:NRDE-2, necessary for RNA interference-domain-containing protein [Gigaspora rosea]
MMQDSKSKKRKRGNKEKYEPETEVQEEMSEDAIRQKIKEFNIQLDQNQNDVNLWLEFIAFQDKSLQFGKSKKADASITRSSINEVKISIFEKALEANPNDTSLLIAYMKCCEEHWDIPKLLTKWDQVLKENSRNINLWMKYLDFRQTNLVSFTVNQCIQVFEDCLHLLRKEFVVCVDSGEKFKIERIMIHIFQRACFFMLQSGYSERAYSCWQAMIELTFFAPKKIQQKDFYDRVVAFENFWEAEWPRFGEDDAKGWSYYFEQDVEIVESSEDVSNLLSNLSSEGDMYEKWVKAEVLYNSQLLPTHSSNVSNLEDPYRVVLFDDIRTFLFDLTSHQSCIELIYACLAFTGLTYNPGYSSSNPMITDTFLYNKLSNESIENISFWSTDRSVTRPFIFPIKAFPQDNVTLFNSQTWFSICNDVDILDVDMSFSRNAFYQLRQIVNDTEIKLCRLSLEYLYDASSGRNLAKNMLKRDTMNLSLWNGYAQVEKSSNNISEARKVYLGAITQYRTFPEQYRVVAPLLHRSFAEMEIEQGRNKTAINILINLTEEQGTIDSISESDVPITKLLRARKYYAQQIARITTPSASQIEARNSLHYCICYALLECLSQNLQQASKVFEDTLNYLEVRSDNVNVETEWLYMSYVKLIHQQSSSEKFVSNNEPGRLLQEVLSRALRIFPNNTIFLSLYFHEEIRGRIPSGLNLILNEALQKRPSYILWTTAIYMELHHQQPCDINRVRTTFDKALMCSTTRHSVSLWILYINFEIKYGEMNKAKAIYYRAMRECPWSKDIYMIAFKKLRAQFSLDELEELMNVLLEKEIRIRVPIEHFADKVSEFLFKNF